MSWRKEPADERSPLAASQTTGVSEAFNLNIKEPYQPGDYLYRSGSFGWDVESGMWGIFRVMKQSIRCRCKEFCGRILKGRK